MEPKPRLLIIEDSESLRLLYQNYLAGEYEIVFTLEREEIEPLIEQVDLILCDYHFSDKLSFDQVREMVNGRRPLILCSGDDAVLETFQPSIHKLQMSRSLRKTLCSCLEQRKAA